jgi:hypothetical protein
MNMEMLKRERHPNHYTDKITPTSATPIDQGGGRMGRLISTPQPGPTEDALSLQGNTTSPTTAAATATALAPLTDGNKPRKGTKNTSSSATTP